MLFSSTIFIFFFFPAAFLVYCALNRFRPAQNIWLLLVSLAFYAWGEPVNVLLLIGSILVNWLAGRLLAGAESRKNAKIILALACAVNLAVLAAFKYTGFVAELINSLFAAPVLPAVRTVLPVGISFFTLRALSYVIDVYRGRSPAEKNPLYVGIYMSFFPLLIAGPVVQYSAAAEQIRSRKTSWRKISIGCCRFLVGLSKKVLLANSLAVLADVVFNWSEFGTAIVNVPVTTAWLGLLAYTLQIYFDFSGFSDMAIGLGLMFGFVFEENFNYPYAANSVTDFWRRWHISLTAWFREYVYRPLGGSRTGNQDIMVRNMFVVWLLIGIWHGAGWNFIFWGVWHFLFLLAEKFLSLDDPSGYHPGWMRLYTLLQVALGWVLFRTEDLYHAYSFFRNLFGLNGNSFSNSMTGFLLKENWLYLLLGIIFCTPVVRKFNNWLVKETPAGNSRGGRGGSHLAGGETVSPAKKAVSVLYPAVMLLLFVLCISLIVQTGSSPFGYFHL